MKKLLLIAVLFFPLFIAAQGKKFDFEFDYAQFAYDTSSNYIEFYYSFGQNSLSQNFSDSAFILEGKLDIEIIDTLTHETVVDNQWGITHRIPDTMDMNKSLVGMISFILPAGEYICNISGMNSDDSSESRTYKESITVESFVNDNPSISNIQLASNILQDSPNKNSIFYKNNFEITPLPTSIYGENLPVVFHYAEIYNLKNIGHEFPLKLNTLVYGSRGNLVFNKTKDLSKSIDSRVEVGTIVVNKFPTDTYTLVVALIDSVGNYGISSSKRFYVLNPSVEINDTLSSAMSDVAATHFGSMSEEELDDLFEKSKYISTQKEIEQYSSLSSIEGKSKFLYQFWNMRDTEPSTPRNEFYNDYLNRIQYSNQHFGALGKKGWKTDRGRIFLKYGEPSEIERFPNQIDTKPYEIWHYNEIEGGVVFIFADITNFSDYQLIHSTARGELRDESWQRRIRSI
jgi:GWxTD domain-containing protein